MSDVWKNFAKKSPQAEKDSKDFAGFGIFLVAACLGGVFRRHHTHRQATLAGGGVGPRRRLVRFGYALLRFRATACGSSSLGCMGGSGRRRGTA